MRRGNNQSFYATLGASVRAVDAERATERQAGRDPDYRPTTPAGENWLRHLALVAAQGSLESLVGAIEAAALAGWPENQRQQLTLRAAEMRVTTLSSVGFLLDNATPPPAAARPYNAAEESDAQNWKDKIDATDRSDG